jgi:hypothetical protein
MASFGMGPGLSPSNRGGRYDLPTTTLGQGTVLEPVYLLGQARPIPSEAMKIMQPLQQTAAAILVLESSLSLSAAAAAELGSLGAP